MYGCSPDKLAATLGKPESDGKRLYDAFWDSSPGLKLFKEAVEKYWALKGRSKYLPAIDGRLLHTRSKHSLVNVIFQSAGAIACDIACCLMDDYLGELQLDSLGRPHYTYNDSYVARIIYYHDEYSWECDEAIAEDIRQLTEKAMIEAGNVLKTAVPLNGEGKIGKNWAEVH